ncbi:MAG: sulfite exporter TauE/SafE family protein [Lentisphaerae bacterium]|nr:sulfite exporter TauE/SafE family protein [Lentisphaerota bacterium]
MLHVVLEIVLGVVIGFSIGLSGVGGGVLVLPALTLVLGLPASAAVGTASLYAFLTKVYACYRHFRLRSIELRTALLFLTGAVPANILVAWLINRRVSALRSAAAEGDFQRNLEQFIAVVVLGCALILIARVIHGFRGGPEPGHGAIARRLARRPRLRLALAPLMGAVIGALIGSTSVGGGVLIIPMLIVIFGLSALRTVGTSIFVAVVLTLVTALIYGKGGDVAIPTALLMAAGSMFGVYWGSRLAAAVPEKVLQAAMAAIVLVSAVLMLLNQTA